MKIKKKAQKTAAPKFPEYNLGERIRFLRTSRGLSQVELAKASKLSQSAIAQIETGKKDASITSLKDISKALDVDVASLFAADDVFVFDLKRLRRKYNHRDKLTPHLYMALGKVLQYAKDIQFLET